jgi:hypothetical protein
MFCKSATLLAAMVLFGAAANAETPAPQPGAAVSQASPSQAVRRTCGNRVVITEPTVASIERNRLAAR